MHIVYKLIFHNRIRINTPPFYYIGSKSNCSISANGFIIDKHGNEYFGSSRWKGWKDVINESINDIEVIVLYETSDYGECIEKEKEFHLNNDVVRNVEYFNLSIATISTYANPSYGTFKHYQTGKCVRLKIDDPLVENGTYVGVTKGRSVVNDPGHKNRGLKGENNPFYGKSHSEEALKKMSEASKNQVFSEETRKKMSNTRKGVPKTEDHKKKIGRKGLVTLKNINTGECVRIPKEEADKYNKEIWKCPSALKQKRDICIYCGKESIAGMIARWHNENCKHKEDSNES